MLLDSISATRFMEGYKRFLLRIAGPASRTSATVLEHMAAGRRRFVADRAVKQLNKTARDIEEDVADAIASLDVRMWVYLRDTARYSVLLDPATATGFGVVGLSQRLNELVGQSGAVIETGVVKYRGRYVCDGLVTHLTWIGPNYRRTYGEIFRAAKAAGTFLTRCPEAL